MKIRLLARIGDKCPLCQRRCGRRLLTRCVVCSVAVCSTCGAQESDQFPALAVCAPCGNRPSVRAVIADFAVRLTSLLNQRNQALARQRKGFTAKL